MPAYRLSREAENDLDGIYQTGFLAFGEGQADLYFDGLVERLAQIANAPLMYPDVSHIGAGYRRSVYEAHAIYYQATPSHVFIVRILKRQSLDTL